MILQLPLLEILRESEKSYLLRVYTNQSVLINDKYQYTTVTLWFPKKLCRISGDYKNIIVDNSYNILDRFLGYHHEGEFSIIEELEKSNHCKLLTFPYKGD